MSLAPKDKNLVSEVDLLDESYLERQNQKLRITAWIDGDIYDELKRRAKEGEGSGKYQTLMNDLLREILFENVEVQVDMETEEESFTVKQLEAFIKSHRIDRLKRRRKPGITKDIKSTFNRTPQIFGKDKRVQAKAAKKK